MPPHKQPPRVDLLCAARFGRRLYERCVTIEQLKEEGLLRQANLLWEQEKLLCSGLPARVVDEYFVPMFREVYFDAVRNKQFAAMRTMLGCLWKANSKILDMSWYYGGVDDSVKKSIVELLPSLRNLRVVILRRSATDESMRLLCRHCEHLEELDVSRADIYYGLDLFGVTDESGVHGCPNLVRLRLDIQRPELVPFEVTRLLKVLKNLEELVYVDMTKVFSNLYESRHPLHWNEPGGGAGHPFPQYRLKGLGIKLQLPTLPFNLDDLRIHGRFCHGSGTRSGQPQSTTLREIPQDSFLDFVTRSCPLMETFKLDTFSQADLIKLQRFLHLRKVSLSVPEVTLGGGFASCINSKLTSLELRTSDLPPDVLVAIGTTCESLTELKISLTGSSRLQGWYPTPSKDVFGNLEVLHYRTEGSTTVAKEEWLYLTSGAKNLVDLRIRSRVEFMTDLFWTNFLTNVNQLERLEIIEVSSGNADHLFSMGEAFVKACLLNCPTLRGVSGSFDHELLSDDEIGKIREEMESKNLMFALNRS